MKEQLINYINSSDPIIREYRNKNDFVKSFLWKTEVGNIMLTLSFSLKNSKEFGEFFFTTSNVDSIEVGGQGKYLWNFLTSQLDSIARGRGKNILHEVTPNNHSLYLVEGDSRYKKKGKVYYALY